MLSVAAALPLVLGAGACTGPPPPVPAAPVAAWTAVPGPAPAAEPAPSVPSPRDPASLAGCARSAGLLAPDLVDPAGAQPVAGVAGSGCSFSGGGRSYLLRADVRSAGLGELYRAREAFRAFRTGTLDGFPTVVTSPEADPSCALHVATSDRDSIAVQVGPADGAVEDPCRVASRAASRLLAALPPEDS